METRRSTGSLSSLSGSGTFTPPMSPRVESPRAAAAVGEKRQPASGKGIQLQIQQLASKEVYYVPWLQLLRVLWECCKLRRYNMTSATPLYDIFVLSFNIKKENSLINTIFSAYSVS